MCNMLIITPPLPYTDNVQNGEYFDVKGSRYSGFQ